MVKFELFQIQLKTVRFFKMVDITNENKTCEGEAYESDHL